MTLIAFIFLLASFQTQPNTDGCITNSMAKFYDFETEQTIIKRDKSVLIVTLSYSDSKKNIKGEKIITVDFVGKRYQYESYYVDLIINPKNYGGLMDNFGKGKWENIQFGNSDDKVNSLVLEIYNCNNGSKN